MTAKKEIYDCEGCGGEFEKDSEWTDADVTEEMKNNFGAMDEADQKTICDDCYSRFMAWWKPQTN